MRHLIIILLAMLFLPASLCKAQTQSNWDEALDRYELLCQRCMELMEQQKKGADIPRESLSSLVTQLSLLKNTLSEARGSMTAAQRSRFDLIRRKFSGSGTSASKQEKEAEPARQRPMSRIKTESASAPGETKKGTDIPEDKAESRHSGEPLAEVSGQPDVHAEVQAGSDIRIVKTDIGARPAEKRKTQFLAAFQSGVFPDLSYGGFTGFAKGKFGAYLKFRDDFSRAGEAASYTCDIEGSTPDGSRIWSDGTERKSRMAATAGALWQPWKRFAFYAGAGYGSRHYDMRDIDGNWARINDLSTEGICLDFGALWMFGEHIFAGAGFNATSLKYTDLEISIGVRF